jgi:hemolysin activation/secretion protein
MWRWLTVCYLSLGLVLSDAAQAQSPGGFAVNHYTVTGDNPLDAEATARILDPLKGIKHGLDELTAVAKALEQELRARGHTFHKVLLPPQTIKNETVELKVQALTIGAITVVGNQHFSEANVRRTVPGLIAGTTPAMKPLARTLALANEHPARHVTLNLIESKEPDKVDAEVAVRDRRPWSLFANFSNIGAPELARSRLSVGGQHANLFGYDDVFTAVYTTSPEALSDVKQVATNYRIPTYRLGGISSLYYAHSDVNSGRIQEVFDVSGAGDFFGYSYSQYLPQIGAYRQQLGIGIDDRAFASNVSFLGDPIGNNVRSRPFTVRYQGDYRGQRVQANASFTYTVNTGGGDNNDAHSYDAARAGSETQWDVFRYDARLTIALPLDFRATTIFEGQIAGEALIPGEQFGVGGVNSVRGFEERAVTGDNGQRLSFELWLPPLPGDVRVLGFVDAGHADRRRPQPDELHHELIVSTGFGLRWQWQQQIALAFDYGHYVEEASEREAGGIKWHVSLSYRY